jgi:uncharacterized RDD family membrane protein YckC
MAGLGWQEIVIVLVIVLIIWAPPIFLIVRAIRHRARHDALRERYRRSGMEDIHIYAGFWDRAGASLLDSLVLMIPTWAIQVVGQSLIDQPFSVVPSILATGLWAAYVVIGNGRGATLGKHWAGLRIVDAAGAAPGLRRAVVRLLIPFVASWVFYIASARLVRAESGETITFASAILPPLVFSLIVLVDSLWMIWDPRKQTLHDKLAGTFVIIPW